MSANSAFSVTGSASGIGSVTSVGISSTDGLLTVSNSPVTSSGTIGLTFNTLPATIGGTGLTAYALGDLIYASASNTLSTLAPSSTSTQYLANTGTGNIPQWNYVNLANGVTGNLPVTHLNSGTGASSTTFWRGDGTWATPPGMGGTVTAVTATSPLGSSGGATPNITLASVVPLNLGGTNAALTASNGGIFYSTASAGAILAGTSTANLPLLSGSSGAPSWGASSYLGAFTANEILYASATNTMGQIATANNSVLATNGSGVPGFVQVLPTQVQVLVGSLNSGSGASAATYWRGDGSWSNPNPSGGLTTSLNYNGTTQTIRQSTNVSSVTYTAVGRYTINFTTAYPNALYAPNFTVSDSPTGNNPSIWIQTAGNTTPPTTTYVNTATASAPGFQDSYYAILNIFDT